MRAQVSLVLYYNLKSQNSKSKNSKQRIIPAIYGVTTAINLVAWGFYQSIFSQTKRKLFSFNLELRQMEALRGIRGRIYLYA